MERIRVRLPVLLRAASFDLLGSVHDTSKWTEFKVIDFTPKTFDEKDVDIKIDYCMS